MPCCWQHCSKIQIRLCCNLEIEVLHQWCTDYIHCVRKKDQNVLCNVFYNLWWFCWILLHSFLNKFVANCVNVFHLTRIILGLPCETWMLIVHVVISVVRKKTLEFIPPQLCLPNSPVRIQLITACGKCCKRRCTKHTSLIWTNRNGDWERRGSSWVTSSLGSHSSVTSSPAISLRQGSWWTFRAVSLTFVSILLVLMLANSFMLFVGLFLYCPFWCCDVIV